MGIVGEYIHRNNELSSKGQQIDLDSSFKDTIEFFMKKFVKMKT